MSPVSTWHRPRDAPGPSRRLAHLQVGLAVARGLVRRVDHLLQGQLRVLELLDEELFDGLGRLQPALAVVLHLRQVSHATLKLFDTLNHLQKFTKSVAVGACRVNLNTLKTSIRRLQQKAALNFAALNFILNFMIKSKFISNKNLNDPFHLCACQFRCNLLRLCSQRMILFRSRGGRGRRSRPRRS